MSPRTCAAICNATGNGNACCHFSLSHTERMAKRKRDIQMRRWIIEDINSHLHREKNKNSLFIIAAPAGLGSCAEFWGPLLPLELQNLPQLPPSAPRWPPNSLPAQFIFLFILYVYTYIFCIARSQAACLIPNLGPGHLCTQVRSRKTPTLPLTSFCRFSGPRSSTGSVTPTSSRFTSQIHTEKSPTRFQCVTKGLKHQINCK